MATVPYAAPLSTGPLTRVALTVHEVQASLANTFGADEAPGTTRAVVGPVL